MEAPTPTPFSATTPLPASVPLAAAAERGAGGVGTGKAEAGSPWRQRLADLVLGRDPAQRLRISRSLTSMVVYAVCMGSAEYAQARGLIPALSAHLLVAGLALWTALIYAALRSGWNCRFADPALSQPQILGAQTWVAAAYLVCYPFRGALMMLLALVLVFGTFNLDTRGRRLSNAYSVVLMGAVMVISAVREPSGAALEIVHFVLMATILPVVTMLGAQLSDTRAALKAKRQALEEALSKIQAMAIRDELTGLYNRRHMSEVLEQQLKRQERTGAPFTLCLIDLDHFKRINDNHGHAAGDEVLRHFAEIACFTLRDTDVLARWGGEEFLLLLPDTPVETADLSIERIRVSLQHAPLVPELPALHVTFSAGLAEFRPGDQMHQVIERADRALYRAKSDGRHCTRAHPA